MIFECANELMVFKKKIKRIKRRSKDKKRLKVKKELKMLYVVVSRGFRFSSRGDVVKIVNSYIFINVQLLMTHFELYNFYLTQQIKPKICISAMERITSITLSFFFLERSGDKATTSAQ